MCLYYQLSGDEDALRIIRILLRAMETNIPRFPDGTLRRKTTMWADDTFMSCPFLVQAGLVTGDKTYHTEAIKQLLGFHKKLWMGDLQIFSHIFFLDTQSANRIPWGRGNGDALEHIPSHTEGYGELVSIYRDFTKGIAALQDEQGLWHQVLDRPDSYSETSCTAMFLLGLCRGIRLGLIGKEYMQNAHRAYRALITHKISRNGTVYGVCMGSGCQRDAQYYMDLGTIDNDDHGTGVVLTALCEYIRLTETL